MTTKTLVLIAALIALWTLAAREVWPHCGTLAQCADMEQ